MHEGPQAQSLVYGTSSPAEGAGGDVNSGTGAALPWTAEVALVLADAQEDSCSQTESQAGCIPSPLQHGACAACCAASPRVRCDGMPGSYTRALKQCKVACNEQSTFASLCSRPAGAAWQL